METAATGEIEKRAVDGATVLAHLGLSRFNICAVEDQQSAALSCQVALIRPIEAAIQPLIGKGAVVGAVIDKLSAKYGLKEGLGRGKISRSKLHIVQFFMGFHSALLPHHQHRRG